MNKVFYLKLLIVILIILNGVSFTKLSTLSNSEYCYYEFDNNYILVEKNIIGSSVVSFLYKDNLDNYISEIYDYKSSKLLSITDLIKEDKIDDYNKKIEELLYLKYPKFISDVLINNTDNSYLLRDNELVIYFNNYDITPSINEVLYLKVNYNEIKDYLNFTFLLDSTYENESGYNYTNAKRAVAFTFDDSPNNLKTTRLLQILKDNLSHATFFIVGEKAINNKDILYSIKSYGNEIGSHSYKHQNYKKLSKEELEEDYLKMNNLYQSIFHTNLKLLRPPYGSYKDSQLNLINTSFILWSLDTEDWKHRYSDYIVNYVIDNIKDGDIILFHDSYTSTIDAIEELLPILYSKGYQVMSVSELANLKGYTIENNQVYHNFS